MLRGTSLRCAARLRPLAIALIATLGGCRPDAANLVVRGATIIDGTGAAPVRSGTLIVKDGRIVCVGTAESCPAESGIRAIDGVGFWIIPGLIDTHVHAMHAGDPLGTKADEALRFLLGVTASRDAGTTGNFLSNVAEARPNAEAKRPVPRLVIAGPVYLPDSPDSAVARAAARVHELARDGASSIKVKSGLSDSVRAAVIKAAKEEGLDVWGHYWSENPTRSQAMTAGEAGYAGYAHLTGISPATIPTDVLDDPPAPWREPGWLIWRRSLWVESDSAELTRLARRLAETGVWLEPLLIAEEYWSERYGLPPGLHALAELPRVVEAISGPAYAEELSPVDRERLRRSLERMRRFVRDFHDAGGVLVTGTDNRLAPGLSLHEEIKALARAGLSPEEALAAATREAAEVIGVSDSLGTLEPGKLADFVVLEGDPLADLTNLELVSRVAKAGILYDPAALLERLKGDLRGRTTSPAFRMVAAILAMLLTIVLTGAAIRRHRRDRASAGGT